MSQIGAVNQSVEIAHYQLVLRSTVAVEALPETIGAAYDQVFGYLGELGVLPVGAPFVCYKNMDMTALEVEIGVSLAEEVPDRGTLICELVPQRKIISALHLGPFKESGPVYEAMMKWMAQKKLTPTAELYEYYLNDPDRPEAEYLTQIVMPLE